MGKKMIGTLELAFISMVCWFGYITGNGSAMASRAADKRLLSATHLAKPLGSVFSFFLDKAKSQRFCELNKYAQAFKYSAL
jgi:hypothetical protein